MTAALPAPPALQPDERGGRRAATDWFAGVYGLKAWGTKLGYGSHLTIEFGNQVPSRGNVMHGIWHIWVYGAPWRFDFRDAGSMIGSGSEPLLGSALQTIDGLEIKRVELPVAGQRSITILFSSNVVLHVFCDGSPDEAAIFFSPAETLTVTGECEVEVKRRALD